MVPPILGMRSKLSLPSVIKGVVDLFEMLDETDECNLSSLALWWNVLTGLHRANTPNASDLDLKERPVRLSPLASRFG